MPPTRRVPLVGEAGRRIPAEVPYRSTEGVTGFDRVNKSGTSRVFVGGPGGSNVPEQVVNVTQNGADDIHPFWTTDEQFIYFVSNRTFQGPAGPVAGTYQIYRVRPNEGLNPGAPNAPPPGAEQLTSDPQSNFSFPVLNANSTQIAFIRSINGAPGQLFVASVPASGQINLAPGGGILSLTANRTTAPFFTEVQRAAYLNVTTIVFAGRQQGDPAGRFHLWTVDTATSQFFQLTGGTSTEMNPAVAPGALGAPDAGLVAFDTDATGFMGRGSPNNVANATGTAPERNIFILAQNSTTIATPVKVTNIPGVSNIQPAWSSSRTSPQANPTANSIFLAFASTRQDIRGNAADPALVTGFRNGQTFDIYFLNAFDPLNGNLTVEAAPGDQLAPPAAPPAGTPVGTRTAYARKLDVADPLYQFNDEHPSWAQFITILRLSHQSDRQGTYKKLDGLQDVIGTGFSGTPGIHDLFISTVVDIAAPTLLRYDTSRQDGEIVHINLGNTFVAGTAASVRTPRNGAVPGQDLFFTVRVEDREAGLHPEKDAANPNDQNRRGAVFLLFKNPNSAFQQTTQEHKEWSGVSRIGPLTTTVPGGTITARYYLDTTTPSAFDSTGIHAGYEYECQGISAANGTYHYHNLSGTTVPLGTPLDLYTSSVNDRPAFSGVRNPPLDGGTYTFVNQFGVTQTVTTPDIYLRMNRLPDSQQDGQGGVLYGATWRAPEASDWYIDVIAYDNAVNPYNPNQRYNWIIYDNVWGFSTASFSGAQNILVVGDYMLGQKFFSTRFSNPTAATQSTNLPTLGFGAESYFTDAAISRIPTTGDVQDIAANPLVRRPYNQQNPFLITVPRPPGSAFGFWNFGIPYVLGVNSYVDEYSDDGTRVAGRPFPPAGRYDIWRILSRGPVPVDVLSTYLPQPAQQTPPDLFVSEAVGRNVRIANRMVIWASPLSGNLFVGPGTITDPETQANLSTFVNGGGRLFVSGKDIGFALTFNGARQNPFFTNILKAQFIGDEDFPSQGITGTIIADPNTTDAIPGPDNSIALDPFTAPAGHAYGRFDGTFWQYDAPGPDKFIGVNNGGPTLDLVRGDASALGFGVRDVVAPLPAAYAQPGDAYIQYAKNINPAQAGIITSQFPGSDGRVAYASYGFDGTSYEWYDVNGVFYTLGRRAEIMHNIVCSFRTGNIIGRVTNASQGGSPLTDVLVRAVPRYLAGGGGGAEANRAAYTAATNADGSYQIIGVKADAYIIYAYRRGFTIQRSSATTVHGGDTRTQVDLALIEAPPGNIAGRILRGDRVTGIPGIEVQARGATVRGAVDVFRAVSGTDGSYTIAGVPIGFYTLIANPPGIIDITGDGRVDGADLTDPTRNQIDINGDGVVDVADIADTRNNINFNPAFGTVTATDPAQIDIIAGGVTFQNGQIQVLSGQTTTVSFILRAPPQDVQGRVFEDKNGNDVFDAGEGLAGASITATQPDANGQPATVGTTTTDADGNYFLAKMPEGTLTITATLLGFDPNSVTVSVGGQGVVTAPDIKLIRQPPGSVSGLVTLGTLTTPVEGAIVRLFPIRNGVADTVAAYTTTTTTLQTDANGYRYNWRITGVAPGEYEVTVEKAGLAGDPARIALVAGSLYGQVVSNEETDNVNFRLLPPHIYGAGLQLISVPLDYSNRDPRDIFGLSPVSDNNSDGKIEINPPVTTDLDIYNVFKVADWTGSGYNVAPATPTSPIFPLLVGKGYFVRFGASASVVAPGTPVATRSFSINLPAGWSLIGHPFYDETNPQLTPDLDITANATISDAGAPAVPLAQAVANGSVRGVVFQYTGSNAGSQYIQTTVMKPWLGYWFYAFRPVTLTLAFPGRAAALPSGRTITRAEMQKVTMRSITSRSVTDWRLQIAARQGDLLDTDNSVGVAPNAKDGFDYQYDTPKPPMISDAESLYVAIEGNNEHGRSVAMADNIQAPKGGARSWTFTVQSSGTGEVTLFWPNINRLPRGMQPILIDVASGRRVSMRSGASSFRFKPGSGGRAVHRFRVEVKPPLSAPLQISNLKSARSRGGGYRFTFTTTQEAEVIAEVQTLTGTTLRRLGTRSRAMEESAVIWDGLDQNGGYLPTGAYVLSLSARDGDGNTVRNRVMLMNVK